MLYAKGNWNQHDLAFPPVRENAAGKLRTVGVELEFGAIGARKPATVLADGLIGLHIREDAYAWTVEGTALGDLMVETERPVRSVWRDLRHWRMQGRCPVGGSTHGWYSEEIPYMENFVAAVHPVAVKLDAEVHARMRELAKARNRTPHYLMREAIAQYVEREEKREAFRQEALTAWASYQTTGLHVSHAEADDWLTQLEAGQDVEPPECHS